MSSLGESKVAVRVHLYQAKRTEEIIPNDEVAKHYTFPAQRLL